MPGSGFHEVIDQIAAQQREPNLMRAFKIRYSSVMNGTPEDQALATRHLKHGEIYTISRLEVDGWNSTVELVEIRGVKFQPALFSLSNLGS